MRFGWLILWPLLAACGSTRVSDTQTDSMFRSGDYSGAALRLREGLKEQGPDGKDRLLYLFDLGLTLHQAGQFEESNKALLEAERLSDIKDYTSLVNETATLLVSDNIKDYSGEDFEKVLVNVYLAMNFAMMGNIEGALVEARKVNHKLYLMVSQGKRKYKQNAFARYLSAILYESEGNWNDAYVDYKKTRELMPELPGLGRDLWRMASLLDMPEQAEEWESTYQLSDEDKRLARTRGPRSKSAEIVVLYENGISPIKRPHHSLASIPEFYPRGNPVQMAQVSVDGKPEVPTTLLHDIEKTAIQNLEEKYLGIIAKKMAGAAAKLIIANQIEKRTGDRGLGALSRMLLFAADRADLRSWNLLPRDLQIARLSVPPGLHTVRVAPVGGGGPMEKTIEVKANQKAFVAFRYMP